MASSSDPIILAIIAVSVLLTVAKLLAELFARLNLPVVLGELTAGIILGPLYFGGLVQICCVKDAPKLLRPRRLLVSCPGKLAPPRDTYLLDHLDIVKVQPATHRLDHVSSVAPASTLLLQLLKHVQEKVGGRFD